MVQFAMTTFRDRIMGESTVLMSSNTTLVAYINNRVALFLNFCAIWLRKSSLGQNSLYLSHHMRRRTFSPTSSVVQIKCFQSGGLFFLSCLIPSAESTDILSAISLLQEQIQNCPCIRLQFPILWLGRRMLSSTAGTISLFMPSLRSLF